jgi:hypothetical protein
VYPTASGQIRLWASICALFVPAFRLGVGVPAGARSITDTNPRRAMNIRGLRSPLVLGGAVVLLVWWIVREPTRPRYLANVVRQARHLRGRYAV